MRIPGLIATITLIVLAGSSTAQNVNPLEGDVRAIQGGAALFRSQCATCHGADARGISTIESPDLTLMWSESQRSASEVYDIIRDGVPGSIMPPHGLGETELWMLVAYLQDAGGRGVVNMPPGDPERGIVLFAEHCAECHQAKGKGGALGPHLNQITRRRSLESLISSVRQPAASMSIGFKTVSVQTTNDQLIDGVLKSEDAFSLLLMDRQQNLRGFAKADLRQINRLPDSLMPVFDPSRLSDSELFDIFNFLEQP